MPHPPLLIACTTSGPPRYPPVILFASLSDTAYLHHVLQQSSLTQGEPSFLLAGQRVCCWVRDRTPAPHEVITSSTASQISGAPTRSRIYPPPHRLKFYTRAGTRNRILTLGSISILFCSKIMSTFRGRGVQWLDVISR